MDIIFPRRIELSLPEPYKGFVGYKPTPEKSHYLEILQSPARVKHTDVSYYGSDNKLNRIVAV